MTRLMTNPELIKSSPRRPDSQQIWFVRESLGLANLSSDIWTSDILRSGSVIHEIKIQARTVDPTDRLFVGVLVYLTSSKVPGPLEYRTAEHVILWGEDPRIQSWYSFGQEIDEAWTLQKRISGSDVRLCIHTRGLTTNGCDIRVGVRYEA